MHTTSASPRGLTDGAKQLSVLWWKTDELAVVQELQGVHRQPRRQFWVEILDSDRSHVPLRQGNLECGKHSSPAHSAGPRTEV
eukprot:3202592-Rhodomonas_salina.1